MPEMEIGSRGVEAHLDHQRLTGRPRALELGAELVLLDQVDGAAAQELELLLDGSGDGRS